MLCLQKPAMPAVMRAESDAEGLCMLNLSACPANLPRGVATGFRQHGNHAEADALSNLGHSGAK